MAQFTNQATMTYRGITTNSNLVTGEITQVLTAQKQATSGLYRSGEILTYVVSLQNAGATDLTGLTIRDNLGTYAGGGGEVTPLAYTGDPVLYYVSGRPQASLTAEAGPPMVITGVRVPAGSEAVLVYRVRANGYAPLGTAAEVTNSLEITGEGLANPVTAAETVAADPAAVLSIQKALSPATVVENGEITYTFTIQNTGAMAVDAADALVLRDTFNPALEAPIAVNLNGAAWPQEGNYTYNAATGEFVTTAGAITVPAATYTQDAATGLWSVSPGVTTLTVRGTI